MESTICGYKETVTLHTGLWIKPWVLNRQWAIFLKLAFVLSQVLVNSLLLQATLLWTLR